MGKDKIEDQRRKPTRRVHTSSDVADYAAVDGALLVRVLDCVAKQGGAIRFGYTSDGGAYSIGVYGDGDPYTDYVKPKEDINDYLTRMLDAWE